MCFVELGRQIYGKAEFNKMMVDDPDILNAVTTLHANDVRKFSEKWHGTVPQHDPSAVQAELAKLGPRDGCSSGGAHRARTEPRTLDSLDDAAVSAEMMSAPWLTIEQAVARVRAAREAAQRVADRHGRRGNPQ